MKVLDPAVFAIRKETILHLARHLFATKGYAETSMDDIAQAAKLQKASLYHYFAGKYELLQQMVDMECERWFAKLADYAEGQTLRETLQRVGRTFLRDMDDPARREIFKILHFESHKNPAIFKAWKQSPMQNRQGFYAVFARHLEPRWSKQKIAMLITQYMGALIHYASVAKLRDANFCMEPMTDDGYVEQLVDLFAKGVENHVGS